MLNKGAALESLLGKIHKRRMLLINPLFLDFCLLFLYSDQRYFHFERIDHVRQSFAKYIADAIPTYLDVSELRESIFDIVDAYNKNNRIRLSFNRDALAQSWKVKVVVFAKKDPVDYVLTTMRPILNGITCIHVQDVLNLSVVNGLEIVLRIKQFESVVDTVLTHCPYIIMHPSIHLYLDSNMKWLKRYRLSLPTFLSPALKGLHVHVARFVDFDLVVKENLGFCPNLTELTLRNVFINNEILKTLSRANETSCLPCLSQLSFIKCEGIKSNLRWLFRSPWEKLKCINLYGTEIDFSDLQILARDTMLPFVT